MKIGILTFHSAYNYGAVLQAYALQKTIESLGFHCEIINYKSDFIYENYKIKKLTEIKTIKELIKWIIMNRKNKNKAKKFENFMKEKYKLSLKEYKKENILECNNVYDCYFVGSDQVWNCNLNGNDDVFFLNFVNDNKKKNSYAASFGYNKIPNIYLKNSYNMLKEFNNISVREKSGMEIINKSLNKNSKVVLDPTFLINSKEWDKISKRSNIKKEYIFVYEVAATPTLIKFSKKLAREKQCDIICLNNTHRYYYGMKNIKDISPEEFLGYIKGAKYIITSSFHGVALSINFQKNFFYELDTKKENNNSRLENITQTLGLLDREIINGNNHNINKNIDYNLVNNVLNREIKKSIDFIIDTIDNVK